MPTTCPSGSMVRRHRKAQSFGTGNRAVRLFPVRLHNWIKFYKAPILPYQYSTMLVRARVVAGSSAEIGCNAETYRRRERLTADSLSRVPRMPLAWGCWPSVSDCMDKRPCPPRRYGRRAHCRSGISSLPVCVAGCVSVVVPTRYCGLPNQGNRCLQVPLSLRPAPDRARCARTFRACRFVRAVP